MCYMYFGEGADKYSTVIKGTFIKHINENKETLFFK